MTMLKKNIVVLLILFISTIGGNCQNSILKINLEEAMKKHQTPKLSDIAKSITYLPLETKPECLLGEDIEKVIIRNDNILVYDYQHCYVFDMKGKYLSKFIDIGKGPHEVIQVLDICYSDKNDLIFAVDPRAEKVVVYDKMYIPKYEFKTEFWAIRICPFNGNIAFTNMSCDYDSRKILFNVTDSKGKLIKSFKHNRDPNLKIGLNYLSVILYQKEDKLFFKDKWCDTIYSVNSNLEISPYMTLYLGKYKNSPAFNDESGFQGKKRKATNLLEILDVIELNNYVITKVNKGFIYCNKETGNTYYHEPKINENQKWIGLENDFDNGPDFLPSLKLNDNSVISVAYPYNESFGDEDFKKQNNWANNVKYNDNPILMIVELK